MLATLRVPVKRVNCWIKDGMLVPCAVVIAAAGAKQSGANGGCQGFDVGYEDGGHCRHASHDDTDPKLEETEDALCCVA